MIRIYNLAFSSIQMRVHDLIDNPFQIPIYRDFVFQRLIQIFQMILYHINQWRQAIC